MSSGGVARPVIKAEDYGLPMGCPKCDYRWLKLPGYKMRTCPEDGSTLVSLRRKPRATSDG